VIGVLIALVVTGLFMFAWYRQQKQKIGNAFDASDSRLNTYQVQEVCRKSASPLISLEYSNGWDPIAKGRSKVSQKVLESLMFNLEEVERAIQCFSEVNLLGKSNFSAIYKGILKDQRHVYPYAFEVGSSLFVMNSNEFLLSPVVCVCVCGGGFILPM
jgi:hypothetical protein